MPCCAAERNGHKHKILPYIYDYRLNANLDMGTYTGIGITATAQTEGEDDEKFDWGAATGNKAGDKIVNIGKQIKELMDKKDKFLNHDLVGGKDDDDGGGVPISGGLEEKYAAMIEAADDSWIDIYRKQIFSVEGSVDPFHVLCYGVKADFVVSANLYVTMGMTFTYEVAKRYNFSVLVKHKSCTNETVDLVTPQYEFTFYVMGTMGIRAGIEFELAAGLFSLKVDSVGVTAGTGVYAQLWGYFFYDLKGEKNSGKYEKTSQYSGAMLIEIGMYLKITFKAQLFSSKKLTYQPTLYENQWPLYSVGERENVLGFAEKDDDGNDVQTKYELAAVKTLSLPSSIFSMRYMDLRTGEIGGEMDENETTKESEMKPGRNCDDATESRFIITMSDPHYTYNPANNTVTVNPDGEAFLPDCEMTIRWKKGTLAFSSEPIERKVTISWSNPNARYIAFDSQGGSPVKQIAGDPGAAVTPPAAPRKTGYDFGGWYADSACTTEYTFPAALPESFGGEKGVTVYAKWNPRSDIPYTVEHYRQELNGTYTLAVTDKLTGTTDSAAAVTVKTDGEWEHFTANVPAAQVAGNGATVVRVYYDRETYTVSFTYGGQAGEENTPKTYTAKYGATVYAPLLALPGYEMTGYSGGIAPGAEVLVSGPATYEAQWTAGSAGYRVEHYQQNASGDGYSRADTESLTGPTGASVTAAAKTYEHFTLNSSAPGAVPAGTIAGDGSLVLKLYYDRETVTVTYDPSGGTMSETTRTFRYGAAFSAPDVTRAGYGLDGWYDGDGVRYDSTKPVTANVTVTARWTEGAANYKVEHYLMGLDGQYPATPGYTDTKSGSAGAAIDLTALSRGETGFAYDRAGEDSYTVAGDGATVVKLYYTRNRHTLTWNLDGGTASDDSYTTGEVYYGAEITPPTVTKEGYRFNGWNYTPPATMPDSNLSYTARWAPVYTVIYHTNGGNLTAVEDPEGGTYTVQYGDADLQNGVYKLLEPTKTGSGFVGWYDNEACTGEAATEIRTHNTTAKEYWAKWESLVSMTYCLKLADGTTIPVEDVLEDGESLPAGLVPGEKMPEPELKDKVFIFWTPTPDSPNPEVTSYAPKDGTTSCTVYAIYMEKNIASLEDLERFRDHKYNNVWVADKTFNLTADIELESEWEQIERFHGTLDGNGHTITYNGYNLPLFGAMVGTSTVKNLTIDLKEVTVASMNVTNWGAIAGSCDGTVQDCHVKGTVSFNEIWEDKNVGGIVGCLTENGQLVNCTVGDGPDNPLYIHATEAKGQNKAECSVGGLVGIIKDNSTLTVSGGETSYAALAMNASPFVNVGGIAGKTEGGTINFSGQSSTLYAYINIIKDREENYNIYIGSIIGKVQNTSPSPITADNHTLTMYSNITETDNFGSTYQPPAGLTITKAGDYTPTLPSAASVSIQPQEEPDSDPNPARDNGGDGEPSQEDV